MKQILEMTFDKHLDALHPSIINCLTNIVDIEDGVHYCQQFIASYPNHQLAPFAHLAPSLLHHAFEFMNKIEYLNRVISAAQDSLNTVNSRLHYFKSLIVLIPSLLTCFSLLKCKEDLNEGIQLLPIAAKNAGEGALHLKYLCLWASLVENESVGVESTYGRTVSSRHNVYLRILCAGTKTIVFT
jgi:hypothetical protein